MISFNTTPTMIAALLLLLMPTTVFGQDGCVSLGNSQVCSAFSQFYIGLPGLASDYPFLLNTTTIEDFDQRLLQYVNSTSNYLFPLGCLSTNYNPTIPYARYSLTRLCAAMIQDSSYSLPCNFNNQLTPPPLCQQTCSEWVDSVTQITSNSKVCMDSAQRNSTLASFNNQCSTWEGFNGTATDNCISGIANEPPNCGFGVGNEKIACQYCMSFSSTDMCCQNVTGCSKPLSTGAIVGIVIGCIVAITLSTFAIFFYCCFYKKKKQFANPFQFMSSSAAVSSATTNKEQVDEDEPVNIIPHTDTEAATTKIQMNSDSIIPSTTQTPINEEFYVVIHLYPPQMPDELELNPGDLICLALHFDDGWALGFNVTTNKKGAFPTVCVIPAPEESLDQLLNHQDVVEKLSVSKSLSVDTSNKYTATTEIPVNVSRSLILNTTNYNSIRQDSTIPKRSASYKSNYDYIEAESPSSPTFHTPFFTSSNNNQHQQQQENDHYEMK